VHARIVYSDEGFTAIRLPPALPFERIPMSNRTLYEDAEHVSEAELGCLGSNACNWLGPGRRLSGRN
jgi:hypothetical protein